MGSLFRIFDNPIYVVEGTIILAIILLMAFVMHSLNLFTKE